MKGSYPKIVKRTVNLGDLAYFERRRNQEKRVVRYHRDNVVEKFPRIVSLKRVTDALEMNLS